MDIAAIRSKSVDELQTLLVEQRNRLAELRFQLASRELKNVHELRVTRRVIARILTVLNSQQPTADSRKQSTRAAA